MGEQEAAREEIPLMVCVAVVNRRPPTMSVIEQCDGCARDVWVSLPMAPLVQRGGARPTCEFCIRKRINQGEELEVAAITDEQRMLLRVELGLTDDELDKLAADYLRNGLGQGRDR